MILPAHKNSLETNSQSETHSFTVGDGSMIFDILRNHLYEFKARTLTQEYISNAKDANTEVGNEYNKIEITIPTLLSPVLKIRDFGPGVTPERMLNVFIRYGASTKRDGNDQIGGFGLGCKSAWAYTDSFTVTTWVDSTKRCYVAHTGLSNQGQLDLVSCEPTTEPNGTEIQVAVQAKDINEFRDAVLRAVYFWEKKPTLKGHLDIPELITGLRLGNIEVIESHLIPSYANCGHEDPMVIISGIPYPIPNELEAKCPTLQKLSNQYVKHKLILHVSTGLLDIAASRERIEHTEKSIKALENIAQTALRDLKKYIGDAFTTAKNTKEYLETYRRLVKIFAIEKGFANYDDYLIDHGHITGSILNKVRLIEIQFKGRRTWSTVKKIHRTEWPMIDKSTGKPFETTPQIRLEDFGKIYFCKVKESVIVKNKRIRAHLDKGNTTLYILEALPDDKGEFDKVRADFDAIDFQTLTYTIIPKEEKVKVTREKTQFCMHVFGGRFKYTTLFDNAQKWFYVPVTDNGWSIPTEDLRLLEDYLMGRGLGRICGLASRALEMVQGDKNFSPFKDWLDNFKPNKQETDWLKYTRAINLDAMKVISKLKGLKDKTLISLIKEYEAFGKAVDFPVLLKEKFRNSDEVKDFIARDLDVASLIASEYPLIRDVSSSSRNLDELAYYINAKFKEK